MVTFRLRPRKAVAVLAAVAVLCAAGAVAAEVTHQAPTSHIVRGYLIPPVIRYPAGKQPVLHAVPLSGLSHR
jgi:hypothetical protein